MYDFVAEGAFLPKRHSSMSIVTFFSIRTDTLVLLFTTHCGGT
jgi:hypothetical protein